MNAARFSSRVVIGITRGLAHGLPFVLCKGGNFPRRENFPICRRNSASPLRKACASSLGGSRAIPHRRRYRKLRLPLLWARRPLPQPSVHPAQPFFCRGTPYSLFFPFRGDQGLSEPCLDRASSCQPSCTCVSQTGSSQRQAFASQTCKIPSEPAAAEVEVEEEEEDGVEHRRHRWRRHRRKYRQHR